MYDAAMSGGRPPEPPKVDGFQRLTLYGFRQFGWVDIDLSNRLTIITGANGAGKTTLLNILGRHFNWYTNFLASPDLYQLESGLTFHMLDIRPIDPSHLASTLELDERRLRELEKLIIDRITPAETERSLPQAKIGELVYRDGSHSLISAPAASRGMQYQVMLDNQKTVDGLYLSSHRSLSAYQQLAYIPAKFQRADQILDEYVGELRQTMYLTARNPQSNRSVMLRMKEALIAAAVYGEGNSAMTSDPDARRVWEGFQEVLQLILPDSLGFVRLVAEPPEVILETETGRFAIDAISGGMNALFELAWQIHLRSSISPTFTVCFDEPENHLHPSLQRTLIPGLLAAFPGVNFIIATHSPFIVTAAPDARVYVLRYNDDKLVNSVLLDFVNKARSAEKTLTEVLGLTSTMPVWAEERFDSIISGFIERPITGDSIRQLKIELEANGLGDELPIAIERYLDMDNPA